MANYITLENDFSNWERNIACQEIDKDLRLDTSQISTSANCFIYAYVYSGSCEFYYSGQHVTLKSGEIMVISPLMPRNNFKTSDDYHAIGLIVHQDYANSHVSAHRNYHLFLAAIALQEIPIARPSEKEFKLMGNTLREISYRMKHPNATTGQVLSSLYVVFLCDLTNSMEKDAKPVPYNRNTSIFLQFIDLLNKNYREHHDIAFYAENLNISIRYLSMIIKNLTGFTVMHFINNRLALEACWLLKATDLSVQQISDQLHFSDQASFSKFFRRMRGTKPIQFRSKKTIKP